MRKNTKIIQYFLISIVFVLNFSCSSNKESEENKTKTTNQELETKDLDEVSFQEQEYDLPKPFTTIETNQMEALVDKFYPIGWSRDGKFAYIIEPVDEATGFYFVTIAVQDLNSDKILWKFQYDVEDQIEGKDLKTTWNEQYKNIKAKLNEYKIIQQKDFQLGKSEFKNKNNRFELKVEAKTKINENFGIDVLDNFAVKLSSSLGEKEIFSKKEKESRIIEANILGQIKSPYENRIAVLISTEEIGFEGPPNIISLKIVGANLDKGFKK